jgi:hypothetical protein
MKRIRIDILAVFLLALTSLPAAAHGDEKHLDGQVGPHGGQVRQAGDWHLELVVAREAQANQESPVFVYVTDPKGAKLPTAGASGTATLLAGKTKLTVPLVPDGDNRLKGAGKYVSAPDMKAIVAVTLAGKPAGQARFTPLAAGR